MRMSKKNCLNPYFIGLSTLIGSKIDGYFIVGVSQSLFYWIIYSYYSKTNLNFERRLVSILILLDYLLL